MTPLHADKPAMATVTQGFGQFVVIPEIPINGTTGMRSFERKQDAEDWLEWHMPGQPILWEVRT